MGSGERQKFDNPVVEWIDSRMPVFTLMNKEYGVFPTPINFNWFWNFGAIASVTLIMMILTGIFLAMNYQPHADHAFDSVERIMRDVNFGWLLRYMHMNGAHLFFAAVYIHMYRSMNYGSYKYPRELLWLLGVIIFLLMMATAFIGYVLPWGQMSFWGATVITNLFSAIPFVGDTIVTWMWGGFSVDNPTLNRFFALHYLLPFVIFAVVFLHVWALHVSGSNNPAGVEPKSEKDTIPFHPYYTMKDTIGLLVFFIIFACFVFFMPNALGHADNYIPADPLVTPAHIVPEWYFLPFYAMLRAITFEIGIPFTDIVLIDAKLGGVIVMFGSIALLAALPWLDTNPVKSSRYRPMFKKAFMLFVVGFFILGYVGASPADGTLFGVIPLQWLGLAFTGYYYAFFLVILPYLSKHEKTLPEPDSPYADYAAKKGLKVEAASAAAKTASVKKVVAKEPAVKKPAAKKPAAKKSTAKKPAAKKAPAKKPAAKKTTAKKTTAKKTTAKKTTAKKPTNKKMSLVLMAALALGFSGAAQAAGDYVKAPQLQWSFDGPFGTYDRGALQRGLQVYRQVCAACHGMKRVYYRNFEMLGYSEGQIKNIAAEYTVIDGPDDEGEMFERPARPSDNYVSPFPNQAAARFANNGSYPVDLSLITKARKDGTNYVYGLLTGYETPPEGKVLQAGQYYNKYKPGHVIAMAPPLSDGMIAYEDGSPQTVEQYSKDVAHFLTWTAEPYMEVRKQTGVKVIFFLVAFLGVMIAVKQRIWADLKK